MADSSFRTHLTRKGLIHFLCGIIGVISTNSSFAQVILQGQVINKKNNEPVAYANIGIVNSNVGTLSNADGSFSILIPENFTKDTLLFSALGFAETVIPISVLSVEQVQIISLVEKPVVLDAVLIKGQRMRNQTFDLGNTSFAGGVLETDTTYAGRSISLLIENKEPQFQKDLQFPVYIEKARLRILKNNLDTVKFRLRINEVDKKTGKPGRDILSQNIIVESTIRRGWLAFELSHLNFQVAEPFYLTFEQILDVTDRTLIADGYRNFIEEHPDRVQSDTVMTDGRKDIRKFIKHGGMDLPGTFVAIATSKSTTEHYSSYVRETSFGEWKKVLGIVTATVTLSNQINTKK